jgi:cupin 2 domain-containing protein
MTTEISGNIFAALPAQKSAEELFEVLLSKAGNGVRIERIVSQGHVSADNDWYDQNQDEWVLLLQGEAVLLIEQRGEIRLGPGDYVNISAHVRHRVVWTHPDQQTVWLAVFY